MNKLYHCRVTPTNLTKNWYPRPTPLDLQFEEKNVSNGVSYSLLNAKETKAN